MIIIRDSFADEKLINELFHAVAINKIDLYCGNLTPYSLVQNMAKAEKLEDIPLFLCKSIWIDDKINSNLLNGLDVKGFEIWCNHGDLGYHLDKDENSEKLSLPAFSSVLYIGPEKINGGQLQINTEGISAILKDSEPRNFTNNHWLGVPFKRNRLVVFSPNLPHLVTQTRDLRVSFSFNVWTRELCS